MVNRVLRDALIGFLSKEKASTAKPTAISDDSDVQPTNKQGRLTALLFSCASFPEDVELSIRQDLLADLIILGHHPATCAPFFPFHLINPDSIATLTTQAENLGRLG